MYLSDGENSICGHCVDRGRSVIGDTKTYERIEYTYEGQSDCLDQEKVSEVDSVSYPVGDC